MFAAYRKRKVVSYTTSDEKSLQFLHL